MWCNLLRGRCCVHYCQLVNWDESYGMKGVVNVVYCKRIGAVQFELFNWRRNERIHLSISFHNLSSALLLIGWKRRPAPQSETNSILWRKLFKIQRHTNRRRNGSMRCVLLFSSLDLPLFNCPYLPLISSLFRRLKRHLNSPRLRFSLNWRRSMRLPLQRLPPIRIRGDRNDLSLWLIWLCIIEWMFDWIPFDYQLWTKEWMNPSHISFLTYRLFNPCCKLINRCDISMDGPLSLSDLGMDW